MKVEGIDHIHIVIRDLDKAVAFFEDVFGVNFNEEINVEKWPMGRVRFGLLGTVTLELISPNSPDSPAAKFLKKRDEGVEAISVKVASIEEAKREMKARGIRQVAEAGIRNLKEAHFHPKDCFGVLFELCEYEQTPPVAVPVLAEMGRKL
jgi:methylmalonyl-CoA/ethylmalonyl-CoA epimerase